VPGGVVGGAGVAPVPVAAKVLPPHLGQLQKLSAPEPLFPVSLRSAGVTYHVLVRITVAPSGSVDNVAILKRAHPDLDASVLTTVRTWRHRPLLVNGMPVPFSYIQPFQFTAD
jgi:protein TonB